MLSLLRVVLFSQWSNRHFRCFRNQNFCCLTIVGSLLKNFLNILWTLHFGGGITVTFSRKRESKRYLNFTFYNHQNFSRISDMKFKFVKSPKCHKGCAKLDNLFRPIMNFRKSSQLSYQGRMPFLNQNISGASFEF